MLIAPRATESTVPEPYVVPPSQKFDGNDGAWSTFQISVGTPGQEFRVLASTQSGVTQVIVPEGCLPEEGPDCPNLRGIEVFNSEQSPGFEVEESSTWSAIGQYAVETEERLNVTADGTFGYDKVALGPAADSASLSLEHQTVAGVAETSYYYLGHIPLGIPDSSFSSLSQSIDSFLYQLRNQTKIPSLSFGYTAGAKYKLKSVFGSLILGGYDSTRFIPNANPISFSFSTDPSRLLTVGVESIMATDTLKGTYSLSSSAHFSLIDSTVAQLWLPRSVCDEFEEAFGLTYDNQTDLYYVNDTIHNQLKDKNPSVTIKLVNSLENTSVNYTNIVLPYAAFDLQASYPYYQEPSNYFPIRRAADESQYVLGRTFLQEAYLIVDYERANFTVAQAAFPNPLPASNIVKIEPPSDETEAPSSKSTLSIGAIAGIAAGGAVLLLLITAGLFFFCRRRRHHRLGKNKYELANNQIAEADSRSLQRRPLSTHKVNTIPHELDSPNVAMFYNQPQELAGTSYAELATPDTEQKPASPHLDAANISPRLPAPAMPRWVEVPNPDAVDSEASVGYDTAESWAPAGSSSGITSGVRLPYNHEDSLYTRT